MTIYKLDKNNIPYVAGLMAEIKPEWWDYEDGVRQLSDVGSSVKNVGWYMGEDEKHPKGWILCAEYELYSCLSIECLGYNENGKFAAEHQLQPLIEEAEKYARDKGLRIFRYIISSIDISCHGSELNEYWKELRDLKSLNRAHFDYFVKCGFKPAGFMPNCYGRNFHGIIMIKEL
jgi:hypothetical protein